MNNHKTRLSSHSILLLLLIAATSACVEDSQSIPSDPTVTHTDALGNFTAEPENHPPTATLDGFAGSAHVFGLKEVAAPLPSREETVRGRYQVEKVTIGVLDGTGDTQLSELSGGWIKFGKETFRMALYNSVDGTVDEIIEYEGRYHAKRSTLFFATEHGKFLFAMKYDLGTEDGVLFLKQSDPTNDSGIVNITARRK
jgi:hypothetical protein